MSDITSLSLNDNDPKFEKLRQAYEQFSRESINRNISTNESVFTSFQYEKVPSSIPELSDEGVFAYQEKQSTTYKYDVLAVDSMTVSFPERFGLETGIEGTGQPAINGRTYILSKFVDLAIIDKIPKGHYASTNVTFKWFTNGYFKGNPRNGHIAFIFKTNFLDLISRTQVRGTGFVIGDVSGAPYGNPRFPSTQFETWFNKIPNPPYIDNILITGPNTVTPILRDNVEYTMSFTTSSDVNNLNKKFQYTISSVDGTYDSGLVDDPNNLIDFDYNDIAIVHVFQNTDAPQWQFKVYDVVINRTP